MHDKEGYDLCLQMACVSAVAPLGLIFYAGIHFPGLHPLWGFHRRAKIRRPVGADVFRDCDRFLRTVFLQFQIRMKFYI